MGRGNKPVHRPGGTGNPDRSNIMYYITSSQYVGPNTTTAYGQAHEVRYYIQSVPGQTNMSGETLTDGWLGTTNDVAEYAHGEYETLEAAREALERLLPDGKRAIDPDDLDQGVEIEGYYAGRLQPWTEEESIDWAYEWRNDITADTTDDHIQAMIDDIAEQADTEASGRLDRDAVVDFLTEHRNALVAEDVE